MMKKLNKIWNLSLFVTVLVLLSISSCKKEEPNHVADNVILEIPANEEENVAAPNITLSWQPVIDPDGDAITYDVYLGTSSSLLTLLSEGQIASTYTNTFELNTDYYWKVVATDSNGGVTESAIWSFSTDIITWSDANHGIYIDPRDENEYDVVRIDDQVWFAENLNYEMVNSWCYQEISNNCDGYGKLYDWSAANEASPPGWHLPSDFEWKTLEVFLGMSISDADETGLRGTNEGTKLKSASGWGSGNGTDEFGFSALPGGQRYIYLMQVYWFDLGVAGFWWSATEDATTVGAWHRKLHSNDEGVYRSIENKGQGLSVRCIRD